MKRLISNILFFLILVSLSTSNAQTDAKALGEKLANEFWKVLKAGTIDSYSIDDGFLALHPTGGSEKAAEIKLIKTIKLGDYKLSDFKASLIGNTIVVTYKVSGDEILGGKTMKPSYRMTVWQKENEKWMLIAHCVMSPPEDN